MSGEIPVRSGPRNVAQLLWLCANVPDRLEPIKRVTATRVISKRFMFGLMLGFKRDANIARVGDRFAGPLMAGVCSV